MRCFMVITTRVRSCWAACRTDFLEVYSSIGGRPCRMGMISLKAGTSQQKVMLFCYMQRDFLLAERTFVMNP